MNGSRRQCQVVDCSGPPFYMTKKAASPRGIAREESKRQQEKPRRPRRIKERTDESSIENECSRKNGCKPEDQQESRSARTNPAPRTNAVARSNHRRSRRTMQQQKKCCSLKPKQKPKWRIVPSNEPVGRVLHQSNWVMSPFVINMHR